MSRGRRGNSPSLYDGFDWRTVPFPEGIGAVICRPKYDENFDLQAFMREGGYPGEFRLPKEVLAVRKQATPKNTGHRDYLEYLGILAEPEEQIRYRRAACKIEEGYVDEFPLDRRASGYPYGLTDYKNNYLTAMMERRPTRVRSGMRQGAVASRSDSSTFPTSHTSRHTTASHSSSSHNIGPVSDVPLNIFASPNHQNWTEPAAPTPINSGYVGVNGYEASVGYSNVDGTVPAQVTCGVTQMMSPEVQVMEPQSVNQGSMDTAEIGDVNEFFVTNVYQREPSNNMHTTQVQSPAIANYQNSTVYKTESVDFGYENGQMYPPVLRQQVYQPQREPPIVRTAAGGECDGMIKFEEPSDYEQNSQIGSNAYAECQFNAASAENFDNFEVMHGIPMSQHARGGGVKNIYATPDSTQTYPRPVQDRTTAKTSQYSAKNNGNGAAPDFHPVDYIKEDSDSDESSLGHSFFSD
ncbi:hypothetical protein RB195_012033 [Necator americanus]|uniref:Uncharacterized protein n=1 Tax=Necator americanus TaxID=51031 RepID=A0ABR1D6S3_NECAM